MNNIKKKTKQFFSIVLSIALLTQGSVVPPSAKASDSASVSMSLVDDKGVYIDANKKLTDYDNGIFMLAFDASSYIKDETLSKRYTSTDGNILIEESGYYLLELWGGDGAVGGGTNEGEPGQGGASGYVYGYIWLEEGQTLFYRIGSDGRQQDVAFTGGGANGSGGDHGEYGSWPVGGGGGYSALYLFDYTHEGTTVTEQERLSNYIMIAAGGGGGGAGSLWIGDSGAPTGGRGGNINSSMSGTLSAEDNNGVSGTYFRGSNGQSSGTSTAYVGRGGSSVPGAPVETMGHEYASESGNDWTGTYNDKYSGGAGGDGNLRGGGGGAGFCGGSGGIMSGWFSANNVGGGGGGSSFIADAVTWKSIPTQFESYLHKSNDSETGGACIVTYLGTEIEKTVDTSYLEDVTLTGSISTYFDIVSIDVQGNGSASYDADGNITISNINMAPDADGFATNKLKINVLVRRKAEFAGGNNVPVVGKSFAITCSDGTVYNYLADAKTDYANVPLNFKAIARSYSSSDTSKTYAVNSLYEDNYASVRGNLSNYWQYDFISSISAYSVQKEGTTSTLANNVSPKETTRYTVGFTVTPKTSTGTAIVGTAVTTTKITATAIITIVPANTALLGGVYIDGAKGLSHDGENHIFNVSAQQTSEYYDIPSQLKVTSATESSYSIEKSGWYYIQAWGGNGQGAGSAIVYRYNSSNIRVSGSGASGGAGGYAFGYAYLQAGDVVTYDVNSGYSTRTSNSSSKMPAAIWSSTSAYSTGGSGGGYTKVSINGTTVLIAGGGGGAGGAGAAATTGLKQSESNATTGGSRGSAYSTTLQSDSAYNGKAGTNGSASASYGNYARSSSGTAGAAGANYRDSRMVSGYDTTDAGLTLSEQALAYATSLSSTKTGASGNLVITCLETDEAIAGKVLMNQVSMSGTFTKYFDVSSVGLTFDGDNSTSSIKDNGDGTSTVTYVESSEEIADVTYKLTKNADGTTRFDVLSLKVPIVIVNTGTQIYYSAETIVDFALAPAEGFLGGNDVPVLVDDVTEPGDVDADGHPDCGVKVAGGSQYMWLTENDITDYANVAINYLFAEENFVTQDAKITCGENINQNRLIATNSIPMPTGDEAWKAEFVEAIYPTATIVSPTATTIYQFTQAVAPKAAAEKANVIPSVSPATFTKPATVYIQYRIINNMTHLGFTGGDYVLDGDDLTIKIEPDDGYLLPDNITITVGGTTIGSYRYTYDSSSGELFIDEQYITGNIVLSGEAEILTYLLTYIYEQADGSMGEYSEEYPAEAEIDLTWYNNFSIEDRLGHEYTWDWQTVDGEPLTKMPAQNWYVVGSYTPLTYTLTVNYYKVGTTDPVADTYTQKLTYQSEYSVVSPVVDGYTPDDATVTGVLEEDTVINVYYTPNDGKLTVFYIYTDSNTEVRERLIKELATDETYTVQGEDIPTITGYTSNQTSIEVTMPATGGVNVYIYYNPNLYTVTFEPGEGILASGEETKTVVYNNIYGYNQDSSTYGELPQPMRNGFEFTGWVDANGNAIDEETIVSTAGDHTLTATWKAYSFKLTIYYQYTDGSEAKPTVIQTHEYGALYDVDTPEITGYTADITEVSGTMGAGNRVVFITYTINIYTIVVHYVGPNGETMAEDYVTEQEYNTDYSIVSPEIPGYTVDKPIVSGVVGAEDIEVTVNYAYIDYTVTVNYVLTEGPGTQPESVVMEYMHIGDIYSIDTPEIEGYTPSQTVVEGTVGTSDIIVTVTYSLNSHSLIIQYQYGALIIDSALTGTAAATSVSTTLSYGEEYAYTSPVIEGYIADLLEVSGTMPDENVIITVYYNQVVSVTVSWGNLTYDYTESEWAPETHEYFIPPETEGSNYVTVANQAESTTKINASISYAANEGFESVDLYFTESEEWLSERYDSISTDVGVDDKVTYWIWLMGNMPNIEYPEEIQEIGICTVTIGGAS